MSSHIVIGSGEIGRALHRVLSKGYGIPSLFIRDINPIEVEIPSVEAIHICFPYSEDFVKQVKAYQEEYNPEFTVIHSTVPVGTSRECTAYHSPVRGVHPNLDEGILTFVKYLAPKNKRLKKFFEAVGIEIEMLDRPENTEALKLWSTTQYGRFIELEKEIYEWCKVNKLDFEAIYTNANMTYNKGYSKLGMSHVTRPILKHMDGPISGHCVLPNYKLLALKK